MDFCAHAFVNEELTPYLVMWQILETTAALMKAQSEEDAKGGNSANEARRWTGVRTIVEARSLLKSLFRAAAGHKAQVWAHAPGNVSVGQGWLFRTAYYAI